MSRYSINPSIFKLIDRQYVFRFYTTGKLINTLKNANMKEGLSFFWLCGTYDIATLDLFKNEVTMRFLFRDQSHLFDQSLTFQAEKFYIYNGIDVTNLEIDGSIIDLLSKLNKIYDVLSIDEKLPIDHEFIKNRYLLEKPQKAKNESYQRRAIILIGYFVNSQRQAERFIFDLVNKIDKNNIIEHAIQGNCNQATFMLHVKCESPIRDEFLWKLHEYAETNNLQIKTTTLISMRTIQNDFLRGMILPQITPRGHESLSLIPIDKKGLNDSIPIRINQIEEAYSIYKETNNLLSDHEFSEIYKNTAIEISIVLINDNIPDNMNSYIRCSEKLISIISAAILSKYGGIENWDTMTSKLKVRISKTPLTLGKIRRLFEEWIKKDGSEWFGNDDLELLSDINNTRNKLAHWNEESLFNVDEYMEGFKSLSKFLKKNLKIFSQLSRNSQVFPYKIEQIQNPTLEALALHITNTKMFEKDEPEFTSGSDRPDITYALGRLFGKKRIKILDVGCGKGAFLYGLSDLHNNQLKTINYTGVNHKNTYQIQKMIDDLEFDKKIGSYELFKLENVFNKKFDSDFTFVIDVIHEIPLNDLHKFISFCINSINMEGSIEITETHKETEDDYFEWTEDDFNFLFSHDESIELVTATRPIVNFGNNIPCTLCSLKLKKTPIINDWKPICEKLFEKKYAVLTKKIEKIKDSEKFEETQRLAEWSMQQLYILKHLHRGNK